MHLELIYSELCQLHLAVDERLHDFEQNIQSETAEPSENKEVLDWMHDQVRELRDMDVLLDDLIKKVLIEDELTRV